MKMQALLVLTTLGNVTQKETICVVLPKVARAGKAVIFEGQNSP